MDTPIDTPASQQIDEIIASHDSWKAELLRQLRRTILAAHPDIVEEVKWKTPSRPLGLPVWSHSGIVCFAEIWKDNLKLLFPKGARLTDPDSLFNARLQSTDVRAIEFREGNTPNKTALTALVIEAIHANN